MTSARATFTEAFQAHRRPLWDLCYRLTGTAADADDLVQETFARAVEAPPPRLDEPLRPWLFRVAVNLGRDLLRRRRRQPYVGPWLPSPVETGELAEPAEPAHSPEARYGLLESATLAFLLALEALTPNQRAVLLLRDVFDYSVRDTAGALGLSEGSVATTHHRARAAMAAYDRARCIPTRALQEQTRAVLERFFGAVLEGDVAAVEALLAEDVRSLSDGGGEFHAARNPLAGPGRVARYLLGVSRKTPPGGAFEIRMLNGLPALVARLPPEQLKPGVASRLVLLCEPGPDGRLRALHVVAASRKLGAVRFPAP